MKKQKVSIVGTVLTVEYPSIGKVFSADVDKYPASVQLDARFHGFKQKFGDAASGGTPAEKFSMVQRIHDSLLAGNWEMVSNPDNSPIVIEAVIRVKKLPKVKQQELATQLDALEDEAFDAKIKEWASNAKIKAEIAKIRAERAAKIADDADEEEIDIDLE